MLPGMVGLDGTSCYIAVEGQIIEIGRILHDQMDLRRHLPFPTDEGGG
jgi:hypothetical protein